MMSGASSQDSTEVKTTRTSMTTNTIAPQFTNWAGLPLSVEHPDMPDELLYFYRFGPFKLLMPLPKPMETYGESR
jgi:hypothetical protein